MISSSEICFPFAIKYCLLLSCYKDSNRQLYVKGQLCALFSSEKFPDEDSQKRGADNTKRIINGFRPPIIGFFCKKRFEKPCNSEKYNSQTEFKHDISLSFFFTTNISIFIEKVKGGIPICEVDNPYKPIFPCFGLNDCCSCWRMPWAGHSSTTPAFPL